MQCYIYSCQDLILKGDTSVHIKAGDIYYLSFEQHENIYIYSPYQSGVIVFNALTLINKSHNQVNFFELDSSNVLCEIKPFQDLSKYTFYVNKTIVKLVSANGLHIYLNNNYYGKIQVFNNSPVFEKISKHGKEYGLIKFSESKYAILFGENEILYCGKYLDYEILNNYIQIYEHIPNAFNIGKLIKYNFEYGDVIIRCVDDRNGLVEEQNEDFKLEYFMESLKIGRYKYAYEKLSYELRADISPETLKQYFKQFDSYKYIDKTNTYITFKNSKVIGLYRFEVVQGLIYNIY